MKRSKLYLVAAQLLVSGGETCGVPRCGGSCCALRRVAPTDAEYRTAHSAHYAAYENADWWNSKRTPENQANRVLALCFMAAIAEYEERRDIK